MIGVFDVLWDQSLLQSSYFKNLVTICVNTLSIVNSFTACSPTTLAVYAVNKIICFHTRFRIQNTIILFNFCLLHAISIYFGSVMFAMKTLRINNYRAISSWCSNLTKLVTFVLDFNGEKKLWIQFVGKVLD